MIRFSLVLSMCFLYILEAFVPNMYISFIFNMAAAAVFFTMMPLLDRKGRIFTLGLFSTGIIIHYAVGDRGMLLIQGITQNMALLSILILAPLLSIPLRREGIIDTVITYLNELKNNPAYTFYGISSFMMTLAPILNMGALRIVHGFVENIKIPSKLLSRSYYIGFTPAVIWSPFFASVGIVLFYLDITYLSYVAFGVFFAILQMAVGIILFRPARAVAEAAALEREAESSAHDKRRKRDLYALAGFVFGLVLLLIVMEQISQKSMLLLVSMVCVIVPAGWIVLRNQKKAVKEEVSLYKSKILAQKMEICLFLSAGLFGNAVSHTPVKQLLEQSMHWSAQQSIGILFLFIILFVTFMAFLGVHQIIVIPLILTSLNFAEMPDITVVSVAFMCIFTWMLSSSISPLNAMNIIISQCVQKNGLTVAFRWNGAYFISVTGMAFLYVYILNWL
ncbi:hypothetical protein LIT38_24695 [Bacillus sp. CMF12]|uniref:hypothetical protein n=1 Tax=Bacillaceae TaxID=186817 RepID=UPI001FB4C09E|nr:MULTISPECIES: hypothetical protein [Bacillaceae]UOE55198.1 hypothetical protein IRB79_26110 [Cytobacillus oceanisediminis]USK49650.1 hypothetical protein LIT38_24695 [Bacillus sp. CMF12]